MFREVQESQTLLINSQTRLLQAQNRKVYQFGFGQSPFMPPVKVMKALRKAVEHKEYSSVQGDPELREMLACFHRDHNGLSTLAEDVIIAPGSKILIFNILMAIEKADVFIPAPAWVSYGPQAKLAGHHIIQVPTSFEQRWRVTPEGILAASKNKQNKTSVLILNYPGNPDGLTYSSAELKDLSIVLKTLDMIVISDEIYGLLTHDIQHNSLATYYPDRIVTTTGLSKWCGAGGWRFGAALLGKGFQPAFKKALLGIGSETYSCAAVPVQMAARVAYESYSDLLPDLKRQCEILQTIGLYCYTQLKNCDIRVHSPQGGFYLFLDFSEYREKLNKNGIHTSFGLCNKILDDTGVVLLASEAFGFKPSFLGARLAYVDFDAKAIKEDFNIYKHAPKVVEGITLICKWIKS